MGVAVYSRLKLDFFFGYVREEVPNSWRKGGVPVPHLEFIGMCLLSALIICL